MTYIKCPTPIRRLLFETPTSILDTFNIPFKFRETDIHGTEYLRIWCSDEEYSRIINGNQSEYINSTASYYHSPNIVRVGFSVSSIISEFNVVMCMEHISKISASTGYNKHIPIKVLDYVRPETDGYLVNADPYTERIGRLQVNSTGGTIGYDKAKGIYTPNLNILFEETKQRLLA